MIKVHICKLQPYGIYNIGVMEVGRPISFPQVAYGLSESSACVCMHGCVYSCLVSATTIQGMTAWYVDR